MSLWSPTASSRQATGKLAEDLAVQFLTARGVQVLARNVSYAGGELDVIGCLGRALLFVEVRSRRVSAGSKPPSAVGPNGALNPINSIHPVETITAGKQIRLRRAAAAYLRGSAARWSEVRFDVIGVTFDANKPTIAWYPEAFVWQPNPNSARRSGAWSRLATYFPPD